MCRAHADRTGDHGETGERGGEHEHLQQGQRIGTKARGDPECRGGQQQPDGGGHDAGGNGIEVSVALANGEHRRSNLHAFWDNILGASGLEGSALAARAEALRHAAPRPSWSAAEATDFAGWRAEAFALAADAYAPAESGGTPLQLSLSYRTQSLRVAERQLALAGYRLALLIEDALGR